MSWFFDDFILRQKPKQPQRAESKERPASGRRLEGSLAPRSVKETLQSSEQPLEPGVRSQMEGRFGMDFSRVRVHTGASAAQSAAEINARAYTVGAHIAFGAGQYRPGSAQGRELIAHELAHTAQQAGKAIGLDHLRIGPAGGALEAQAQAASGGTALSVADPSAAGLVQRQEASPALPVATFQPAPGIFVDRAGNAVTITGNMQLTGGQATVAAARSIQDAINNTWNASFPDGHSITCTIIVTYLPPGTPPSSNATQITLDRITAPSHVSGSAGSRTMTLNASEPDATTWTPAHEFGHIIGLRDRYTESIMSTISGQFGGARSTPPEAGYSGNLMAQTGGVLEGKNLQNLQEENAPGWTEDDDQVRDWLNRHSLAEIGRLSTATKLRLIHTLMGGWISDEDVNAISRICRSVTTRAEADQIRAGVDLLEFSSIGQRTMVRVAFAQMP
jgi:hypothetical protein